MTSVTQAGSAQRRQRLFRFQLRRLIHAQVVAIGPSRMPPVSCTTSIPIALMLSLV